MLNEWINRKQTKNIHCCLHLKIPSTLKILYNNYIINYIHLKTGNYFLSPLLFFHQENLGHSSTDLGGGEGGSQLYLHTSHDTKTTERMC